MSYCSDSLHSYVLTAEDVNMYNAKLATIKRRRNEISDTLLTINTSNMVEVPDSDWAVLQDIGIV
jgi:hypothetical protein